MSKSGRVLTHNLREVKQLKETAVCESIHGSVRRQVSNPSIYSIRIRPETLFLQGSPIF